MDPNTALEATAAGANAITKFQEIIQKVFNPKWTRAQTDAEMDANERRLQMIRDNPDMDIVFLGDEMHARRATFEELEARAKQRVLGDAIREERNIENVLEVTAKELPSIEGVSDESVDDDWIARFFSIVKDINSEEMQYVWGKILAGEIEKPGRFSLRTLDTLKNISQKESAIFQKILPLIVSFEGDVVIASKNEILEKYGVTYADILKLDECGLLIADSMLVLTGQITKGKLSAIVNKKWAAVLKGDSAEETENLLGIFTLTTTGRELAETLEYEPNVDYLVDVAKELFDTNKSIDEISIHKVNWISDGQISYEPLAKKVFTKKK